MSEQIIELNEELQCFINSCSFNLKTHEAILFLPAMNCCDMRGAISFAKRIDPKVKRILTIEGSNKDTVYDYDENFGWESQCLRAAHKASGETNEQ